MMDHTIAVLGAEDPEMNAIEALLRSAGVPVAYAATMELASPGAAGSDSPADREPRRVIPSTAYQSDTLLYPPGSEGTLVGFWPSRIVTVECSAVETTWADPAWWGRRGDPLPLVVIDHHRPGDPGFGRPPAEFLPASSVGQVIAWLAREAESPLYPRYMMAARMPWEERPYDPTTSGPPFEPGDVLRFLEGRVGGRCLEWHIAVSEMMHLRIPAGLVLTAAADHCLAAAYAGQCPGVEPADLRA